MENKIERKTRVSSIPVYVNCYKCELDLDINNDKFYQAYSLELKEYIYLCKKCYKEALSKDD